MDIKRAIRFIRHNAYEFGVDPDRIGVLGFSAGGHLCAYAGTHFDSGNPDAADPVERMSSRPNAMILCYPVITYGEHGAIGCLKNLYNTEDITQEDIERESMELHVKPGTPPAFMWHTSVDDIDVRNSLLMGAAMREKRIPFELHVFPLGPHGMTLGNGDKIVSQWTTLCYNWLESIGFR